MLKYNIWLIEHNDEVNLYVYKFDYEISKIANKITKISGTIKRVVSYLQKANFFSPKSVRSAKFF